MTSSTDFPPPAGVAGRSGPDHPKRVELTLAVNDYDHTRDISSGAVSVDGVALTVLNLPVEEIFWRFAHYREWDVTELSLAKYSWMRGRGDDSIVAIPAFTSRAFRHAAIFVAADGPVDDPARLKGGRIGIPEWTQTATVYGRGILADEYGIGLSDVEWVQAGTNEPGRKEGVDVTLPDGVTVTAEPERTLNDMLIAGEIDAVIAAHPPTDFKQGSGRIVQLFSNTRDVEEASFRATGVFPIMHVVAIRAEVYHAHRWIAMSLYKAFTEAKKRALVRAIDFNAPSYPTPWAPDHAARMRGIFGEDPWPYGIEPNRKTLETFLRWSHTQGVSAKQLTPEDLFVPEVATSFVV